MGRVQELVLPAGLREKIEAERDAREVERARRYEVGQALAPEENQVPAEIASKRAGQVRLYDPKELEAFKASLRCHHTSRGDRDRAAMVIETLANRGPWRWPLRSSRAILANLARLRSEFPNCKSVIDMIESMMVLNKGAVTVPPVCLDGPPGVGKTMFATRLAEALAVPFRRLDMGATQASFALAGSDKAFENAQVGCVFDVLVHSASSSCAPMLLLDEADKCSSDERYPVFPVLLSLLEPLTARDFRDCAIPQIGLDTRHVVWVLSSNDAGLFPEALRSRVHVFKIEAPATEDMRRLVRRVAASIWRETGRKECAPTLRGEVLDRLSIMPMRKARLAIVRAFGKAVLAGRRSVQIEDLPDDMVAPAQRIGFR